MLHLNTSAKVGMRLSLLSLCLGLIACHDDNSAPQSTTKPVVAGSLTVTPSLGKISNADVILKQINGNKILGTLNTGSTGSVTFNNIASDVGDVEIEVKSTTTSMYFDEATEKEVAFTGSLHVATPFASSSSVAVTPLTEAAYQYAKQQSAQLTTQLINTANKNISTLFGIEDITKPVTVVGNNADLKQLKNTASDAYALLLAAIAESAQTVLGNSEVAPALKASLALAADTTDGKIDGKTAAGVTAPTIYPYATTNYAQSINAQLTKLVTDLQLPTQLAQLIKLPETTPPTEPPVVIPPVTPPVQPSINTISSTGTLTTANTASPSFTPDADGFELKVSGEETEYRFSKQLLSGNVTYTTELIVKVNPQGQVVSVSYSDFKNLGTTTLMCYSLKPCQGITVNTSAITKSVSVTFADTNLVKLTGGDIGATLKGTLTGSMTNPAAWFISDLPRSTDGTLNVNGVNEPVISTRVGVSSTNVPSGIYTVTNIDLATRSGVYAINSTPQTNVLVYTAGLGGVSNTYSCDNCATALSFSGQGEFQQIKFDNLLLKTVVAGSNPNLTVNNTVVIGSTKGTLTSSSEGDFEPLSSSIKSHNDELIYHFTNVGTVKQSGISGLTLTMRGSTIVFATATVDISNKVYACYEKAEPRISAIACGDAISIAANKRTLTLKDLKLNGGGIGEKKDLVLNGTITNKGI